MAQGSQSNSITKQELLGWFINSLIFSIPAILAFLLALQTSIAQGHAFPTGLDLTFALGAAYSALLSSLIGLLKKFTDNNTHNS